MPSEPVTAEGIQAWIDSHVAAADRFADVAAATAEHREQHGCDAYESGGGVTLGVIVGEDLKVLRGLSDAFDLIFYDANVPTVAHLDEFERLLSRGGTLLTSNLFLGRYAPDLPLLDEGARYRDALFSDAWLTSFVNGKAFTVRSR